MTAGAVWVALLRPPPWVWLAILLAVGASVMWIVMGVRSRRRIVQADRHRLVLDPHGVSLLEGAEQRDVRWDAVEAIETDEESLVVRVSVRGEEPLALEPRYGGLGAYDLEEAIRRAMTAARASLGPGEP